MNEIIFFMPEVFLGLSALALLLIGLYFKSTNYLVISILAITAYLLFKAPAQDTLIYNEMFKSNELAKTLKFILLSAAAGFFILFQGQKLEQNSSLKLYEFNILFLLSLAGMMLMLSASNFLSFFVSLELQSFCLYVLAAFEKENEQSCEAGLKYFILGSFASGILLFGISLIYGYSGNFCFQQLHILLSNNPSSDTAIGLTVGLVMVFIGLFFKISAAPFHMWTPDVYQGAPTIVTCLFATVAKVAAIGFLIKFTSEILVPWKEDLQPILILVTCISALVGAIGALKQANLKRLLSYSSIGHVGFMLLAISSFTDIANVTLYLAIYISMTLGTFAMILNIRNDGVLITKIEDLSGLSLKNPVAAITMSIFMFSLAGIPPMAGFFAKFYVFQSAINASFYIAIIVSLSAAVISAYYYLNIVKIMYFQPQKGKLDTNMSASNKSLITLLALFNLLYIFV